MQMIFVKRKRIIIIAVVIIIICISLRLQTGKYSASVTVPIIHPSDAWELVADFSNMKYLNPTIKDFRILSETGNYEHWIYSVEYTENLSHWPYLSNFAIAHFDVKALPRQNVYFVLSNHNTCLFMGLICLKSTSEFKFSQTSSGALCHEHVEYQCPALFYRFCQREVEFQRTAIMKNLLQHFIEKAKMSS